jgi:Outer membrane protein beta-barrel domain
MSLASASHSEGPMRHRLVVRHLPAAERFIRLLAPIMVMALVLPPAVVLAQRRQFGAKAGPAFAQITPAEDDGQSYSPRIGPYVGGFFVLPLNPRLAVQFEGAASPKGTRLKEPPGVTQTLLLQYFEMPVLLRVAGPKVGGAPIYFIGGPFFGFKVGAKEQVSQLAGTVIAGAREKVDRFVEPFESGLMAGAGIDVGKYMLLEGRYSHGLTDVNKIEDFIAFTNHTWTFTVGVRF